MTHKAQTMLTIALTFAVTVLITDRMIEPAHAQACPTIEQIRSGNNRVIRTLMDCNFEIMRVQNRNARGYAGQVSTQKCAYPTRVPGYRY